MARPRKVRAPSGAQEAGAEVAKVAELAVADAATAEASAPAEEPTKQEAGFTPGLYKFTNNTPSAAAIPSVGIYFPTGYSEVTAVIEAPDRIKAFKIETDAICLLNGWVDGFTVEPVKN